MSGTSIIAKISISLSWQVDDDGSLSGLVVHMWNLFIRSEIASITPENSFTPLMHHVIYVTSLIIAIVLET